jgi:CheY-like chemotaxis protein
VVPKPAGATQAERLMDRAVRVRLPSRLLVVDDSPTMRGIVRKILSGCRFPHEVVEASSGFEALKHCATGSIDVVIIDYNMPCITGVETVSEIRRQFPKVGAVMMTAQPIDDALSERARAAGAIAILKKPFFATDLDAAIRRLYGLFTP